MKALCLFKFPVQKSDALKCYVCADGDCNDEYGKPSGHEMTCTAGMDASCSKVKSDKDGKIVFLIYIQQFTNILPTSGLFTPSIVQNVLSSVLNSKVSKCTKFNKYIGRVHRRRRSSSS